MSTEFPAGKLTGHRIAGRPIVVWRTKGGKMVALEDRCTHKRFPLSQGRLMEDGRLECAYHGLCYNDEGKCIAIPSQQDMPIPPQARVPQVPINEQDGIVWVWPGDPAKSGESSPPRTPEVADEAWETIDSGPLPVRANYLLLIENLLDITHFYPLHDSNIGDTENLLNIAEGGLQNLQALLTDMNEKVLQAANDTQGTNERSAIFQQLQQLGEEVDSVARQTQFNSVVLLTVNTMTFQSGPDGADFTVFRISSSFTSAALSVNNLTVASQTLASTSLGSVTAALTSVSTVLQQLGASLQRMRIKADNLSIGKLNVIAAQSRIVDADLAAEQLESSKLQILQQTATAMLAAANNGPASILALFQ